MPKNRKKKNNQQKKKNNNNNKNQKTLEQNEKLNVEVVAIDTINASNTFTTAVLDETSTQNNYIDGNAPILNTTNEENKCPKEFECASTSNSSTNKNDADYNVNVDHQYDYNDASSSKLFSNFENSSTPQHQSTVFSETIKIDESINNNSKECISNTNKNDNNTEIENISNINEVIVVNNNINSNVVVSEITETETENKNNFFDEKSCSLTVKTGSSSSKDTQIPKDDATDGVKLIRTEVINREMQIFNQSTVPVSLEECDKDVDVLIDNNDSDKQLSIQITSVTYHLNPSRNNDNDNIENSQSKLFVKENSSENIIEIANLNKSNEINETELESQIESKSETNFINSLKKVYESDTESVKIVDNGNNKTSDVTLTLLESEENINHPEIEQTFSEIVASFDKLDEDFESAFLEISKDEIINSEINEKTIKENDSKIPDKTLNKIETNIKVEPKEPKSEICENLNIKEITNKSAEKKPKFPVKNERVFINEENVDETFSEIVAGYDKIDQDIELVFGEISKNESDIKADASEQLDEIITQLTTDLASPPLPNELVNFTVTSPISVNSSDENLKEKASHFLTIEDISEELNECDENNQVQPSTKPVEEGQPQDKDNIKTKDVTGEKDISVKIEDLSDDDDDIVILSSDDKTHQSKGNKDYNSKKINKRIALQTHFLPQIIEPRYLDCIKEENSDLSDADKKDDSDVAYNSDTSGLFDDLEDEVFYDNEIYQKANAVYPKIQLDFSKMKKKAQFSRRPFKPDVISEEDVQTSIVEAKLIEQPKIEEGCSKTWSKNLTPSSEQAEIIYLTSASSSSSEFLDSDTDTKETKSKTEYTDDLETRITTPTIDYNQDVHGNIIENEIFKSSDDVVQLKENNSPETPILTDNIQKQLNSSPTCQANDDTNSKKINNSGEISENIPNNESLCSETTERIETLITTNIQFTSTPVSSVNNNFMISENSQLVSNENLNKKEDNFAENFAKQPPTGTDNFVNNLEKSNKLSDTTTIKTTTTTSKSLTQSTTSTETASELSEKNLNIHNDKINTNKTVNLNTNLSNTKKEEEEVEEEFIKTGNTLKGINRQESAESYCSAHSHSTVSSQCTAIRKGSPGLTEDNISPPAKSLKQICLDSLSSTPYGTDVIEELAEVSQTLDYLTDKTNINLLEQSKCEQLLNSIDMPYPLPEPPIIHNIEVRFEPSKQTKNNIESELPPPLPKSPSDIPKSNGTNLSNYKAYINELKNISVNTKTTNELMSKDLNLKDLEKLLHKNPSTFDSKLNSHNMKNGDNYQQTSKYNITSSSELRTNNVSTEPPPVPPLPSFKRETNLIENFTNRNNTDNQKDHTRLLAFIRNTAEPHEINKDNTMFSSSAKSSETKTEKKSSSTSTTSETKSEHKTETKRSSIFDDQSDVKKSDHPSAGRHLENDDLWKFLNDPNYFKASIEKFPTTDLDAPFPAQMSSSTTPQPPVVPKRYSNIETSSFESKKVYENGKLVSEIQNKSHNDRVDENSLSSLKKFMSDSNFGDDSQWSSNNSKTFKNSFDATDSINKNVAIDKISTQKQTEPQIKETLTQQKQQTQTESRKSDDFSYDEFRQRAKERAERKTKSEIFNTDDIFKEFKRFSENLDRDMSKRTENLRSSYGTNEKINIPIKVEHQQDKVESSDTKIESDKKETQIPIQFENEFTTKKETRTETVVKEEINEINKPSLDSFKKEFNIPINLEQVKRETTSVQQPPPPTPPPKTEHTIPILLEQFSVAPKMSMSDQQNNSKMWTGTAIQQVNNNISKSEKEINIPIKIETKEEHSNINTSSKTQTEETKSSKNLYSSSSQTDSNQTSVPKEYKVPINIENSFPLPKPNEHNVPIRMETGSKQFSNKTATTQFQENHYKSETEDELSFPRSVHTTGFNVPIRIEPSRYTALSDDKRRRTYSSSAQDDMYRSDNTSDYWRSTENMSTRAVTPNAWRSSVELSSRVSTPSLDKIVKPIEKEVEICMFGKSSKIHAPRLTASTSNLTYYVPCKPDYYNPQENFNYLITPNRSTSRRKYYTSCHSMIEETPNVPYLQQPHFIQQNRHSIARDTNPQSEYIRRKEDELKKEYMALEDERQKLLRDLTQFNETLEREIFEAQLQKNAENRKHVIEEMNHFHQTHRNHNQSRRRSWNLPSLSEEEALQQRMRNEWLNKIAERENRQMQKVIKITKPSDELSSLSKINQNTRKFSDSINIGDEFLRRVKERRTKLSMPADSDWESGAESQPIPKHNIQQNEQSQISSDYNVKILENRSEADLKNLPKHLFEFAEFVKKFEEEHKDLGIFEKEKKTTKTITNLSNSISSLSNGVWSPNNNEPFKVPFDTFNQPQEYHSQQQQHPEQQQQQQQQNQKYQTGIVKLTTPPPPPPPPQPQLSVWKNSESSPQQSRKFRPVKFESPTLSRKYVREGSSHVAPPWAVSDANTNNYNYNNINKPFYRPNTIASTSGLAGTQSFSCSSLNNIENNSNQFNNYINNNNNNNKNFGSSSSLKGKENLQRVHSTGYIKPNEVGVEKLAIQHKQFIKNVYSLKHEYLSEPEIETGRPKKMAQLAQRKIEGIGPTTKDGMPIVLRSEVKQNNQHQWYKKMFQTLHKAKDHDGSIIIRYKSPKGRYLHKTNGYTSEPEPYYDSDYSSMKYRSVERKPRTQSTSSAQNERSYGTLPNPVKPGSEPYKNQPGKIENFTPGNSSVSEKERKDWWDEVMDIFNGHWEQQKLSPHYTEGNLSRALKEHEYDSDSNLIFRKKGQNLQSPLSPVEQKQAYLSLQAGGEPPLLGFRKPAPEKPKETQIVEYKPINTQLSKIRVYNSPFKMERRSKNNSTSLKASKSYTMLSTANAGNRPQRSPPTPPNRNSSKTRSSTTIRSISEYRKPRISPSDRHYSCFQTENNIDIEPQANKFGTVTLRKHGKRESILQQPTRSKSTGAISTVLSSKLSKEKQLRSAGSTIIDNVPRSRTSIRPQSVRISTSISPPSRPTSRLTSLRQSSPSPIAFGRSISKERAFAVEKKRLENTLPLCKRSFASSTNILKDPNLKSPDEVVKAIQNYAHIHPLARSKSAPKTVYSACSKSSSTFQQTLSSIKKKLSCVDKIHSRYHSNVPKSSASISREYRISQTPFKSKAYSLNKMQPISKSTSKISGPKTNSNLSLARSNSTYSIDSTGSKKNLRKTFTCSRSKLSEKTNQDLNIKKIPPPPPPPFENVLKKDNHVMKKESITKSETNLSDKRKGQQECVHSSNTFFQNLFLRDSNLEYEDDEFDIGMSCSVQERAKYFDTFSKKSDKPILFTGRYMIQKKTITEPKSVSYQSRSLSPKYRQKNKKPLSEESNKVDFHMETIRQISDARSKTLEDEDKTFEEQSQKDYTRNRNIKSFSPTREVRIHPNESRSFSPTNPVPFSRKREFSPTREIRVHPDGIRSYSPPPQISTKKYFSPSSEVRLPSDISQHSYLPYGSLKTTRSKSREFSPTREVRVDQDENCTIRKSRTLGRSFSVNQDCREKSDKPKFSPSREVRICPKETHSYGNFVQNAFKQPDYSPTREIRISPKEYHSYGTAFISNQKTEDYSPTREIRISPKESHSYASTIPRRSKPKGKSFSQTREIRTNPRENRSYSPPFPLRPTKDESFSPTRETRICPTTKQSYVPHDILCRRKRRDSFSPTREIRIDPGQNIDQLTSFQSNDTYQKNTFLRPFSPTREVRIKQNRHSFPYTADEKDEYVNITPGDDEIHITLRGTREFFSPSRRRIQTVQKSESTVRASSLSSADDRSKRGLYYCSELSHSASSLNELESHERRCRLAHSEKFNDLHRFYSNIERHGQLEKTTSATELRPIRKEGEILDFEEWRKIRAHQKAEKELNYIVKKLKQDEKEKDFLFRPKEIEDVKWKDFTDSGLRCRQKSVEDIRDDFEIKMKNNDLQPKSFDIQAKKDLHKPFWRGSSVADMATTMEVKYNSDKGWALKKKQKPIDNLGLSKKLVSTLSKDQVHTIKKQLNEIYSNTSSDKIPTDAEKEEKNVITVDKITKDAPGQLIVRCNSSITQEELLEPILKKKEAKQKRYSPTESKKSLVSKSSSCNSIKSFSESQYKQSPKTNIHKSPASYTSNEKPSDSPISSFDREKYTGSSTSETSKITVIHNEQPIKKDIKTTIKYFEEKKMEEPPKTIYHAREDSSPDEDEILKLIEGKINDRKCQTPQKSASSVSCYGEHSNSVSDLRELFGETEISRVNFRLPQPPPPPDDQSGYYSYKENYSSLEPIFLESHNIVNQEFLSPLNFTEPEYNSIDCSQFKDIKEIKENFETNKCKLKKSQSDSDVKSNKTKRKSKEKIKKNSSFRNGEVSQITHKFESNNSVTRGRTKERKKSISPIPKISKKRDDRMMPHIDIISKTAALKQEISRKIKSSSPVPITESVMPSGEFERIRYKFESPERSPYSQLYSSSPDISELRDISTHLSGNWIAHRYPKEDSSLNRPKKKIIQQRPTSCSPPRNHRQNRIDIFANQKFDPSIHRPKARYVPSDTENSIKIEKRYTVRKESDVAQSVPSNSFEEKPPTENGKLNNDESPYRYYEGDVNIHYKTPIRYECKDIIPNEELARQQAESMIKIYEEERRRKYLQELQDMNNRRHTDNYIPNQKSPIPLNRYDEFNAELPEPVKGPKTVAKALFNFSGESTRELSFRKGDYIYIRRQIDTNWYEGEHNGVIGLLPVNYVEIVAKDGVRKPIKRMKEGQARAKFNFQAQSSVELSLNKGELVTLTKRVDDNWFEGKIANRKGIFPVAYVDVLTDIGTSMDDISSSTNNNNNPSVEQLRTTINSEIQSMGIKNLQNGFNTKEMSSQKIGELHVDTDNRPIVYRALYKYRPQNNDELDLQEGDLVHVLEKCDDGWYVGTSERTGCFGTFPGNYVERV